jgi:hypothetical protein
VFIGIAMNETEIRKLLENTICNADELMDLQDGFFNDKDPFPVPKQFYENSNSRAVFHD